MSKGYCPECQTYSVELVTSPGRTIWVSPTKELPIPSSMPVKTCGFCGYEFLDSRLAQAVEEANLYGTVT